ncbi:hypothetical protein DFH09DRAFT_1356307 [Mycena vulgaris]|nr:hypothetical protein DFH09DRAFT_1356307 [Mycena vulgaris]
MPRILPRLVKLPLSGHFLAPRPAPVRPLRKPVPPLPSALPADYPRSVLLSPGNIITNSHDYVRHKSMPPVYRLRRHRMREPPTLNERDSPREMSPQERIWWSSPYLRMLASPIRQCFLTERYLPADFMVRLTQTGVPLHLRQRKIDTMLFPDGLQHPKFKMRKVGRGVYIVCRRESLALLLKRGKFKRHGVAPPRLAEQIGHLLRLRVLQELQLIAEELEMLYNTRTGAAPARPPTISRLTRAEWGTLRTTGAVPHPGALAILVVPPVNRDPTTKQRPPAAGAISAAPPVDPSQPQPPPPPKRELPPLCVLHRTVVPSAPPSPISEGLSISSEDYWEKKLRERERAAAARVSLFPGPLGRDSGSGASSEIDLVRVAPHAEERVPLYNGVALFPGRVQRARLYALLTRILGVEGAWRFSAGARSRPGADPRAARKGDHKGSHAFLVCASDEVDMAALGVALWRVRMWEGGGWRTRFENGDVIEEDEERWPWVEGN